MLFTNINIKTFQQIDEVCGRNCGLDVGCLCSQI